MQPMSGPPEKSGGFFVREEDPGEEYPDESGGSFARHMPARCDLLIAVAE